MRYSTDKKFLYCHTKNGIGIILVLIYDMRLFLFVYIGDGQTRCSGIYRPYQSTGLASEGKRPTFRGYHCLRTARNWCYRGHRARAVQAATAPSPGQQMLQDGYQGVLANGVSREEHSTTTERGGLETVQKRVERGIVLPDGKGVFIQQAVEHVSVAQGDIGKRKLQDDLELDERRMNLEERRMRLQRDGIENDRQRTENRVCAVLKYTEAIAMLNPNWKSDQRMVLQFQEVPRPTALDHCWAAAKNLLRVCPILSLHPPPQYQWPSHLSLPVLLSMMPCHLVSS